MTGRKMKMAARILKAVLILTVITLFASSAFGSEASYAVNNFAFSAGKIIMSKSAGNFFFSPFSIISAFGMAYAGASGDTAAEIESSLGINQGIHDSLGGLMKDLNGNGYISSANRVWLKNGLKLHRTYTDLLRLDYDSSAKELDIKGRTEESRKEINRWVSRVTRGKITDLLQTLDPETRMIITNAVYFNAEWQKKFQKSATKSEKFYAGGKSKEVPMMKQRGDFMYAEIDGVKAVMLPYKGYRLSMIAVLPPRENPEALNDIDAEKFSAMTDSMKEYDVDLWLPKFKTEKRYELKNVFESLGVKTAFTNQADFSGITSDEPLKADEIVHETFINVDEERTEAAAATAMPLMMGTAMPERKPFAEFHADHPFMYFIRDNESGTILFMGCQNFGD